MKLPKTLLYTTLSTTSDSKYIRLFYNWLFSIRTLGNYQGEILVGNYGIDESILEKEEQLNVKFVDLPSHQRDQLSNYRNLDMIPILESYSEDYKFAHFDVDIWFQGDINPLFEQLDEIEGCYFGKELHRTCAWRGPRGGKEERYYQKHMWTLEGFIFGGWIAGRYEPFLNKLKSIESTFSLPGWNLKVWGTDQCLVTYLFNPFKDNCTGLRWGATYYFSNLVDNKWIIKPHLVKKWGVVGSQVGVHICTYGVDKDKREKLWFEDLHPELFEQEWKKII